MSKPISDDAKVDEFLKSHPDLAAYTLDPVVSEQAAAPGARLATVLQTIFLGYSDRPALAQRKHTYLEQGGKTKVDYLPEFETTTYGEVWKKSLALATVLRKHGSIGSAYTTLGFTTHDNTIADIAGFLAHFIVVPLQTSAPVAQLTPIVQETNPVAFATSIEHLATAADVVLEQESYRYVVVFDYHEKDDEQRELFTSLSKKIAEKRPDVEVVTLDKAIEQGAALPQIKLETDDHAPDYDPDQPVLLIYTSGSTGTPKGAIYPERIVVGLWTRSWFTERALPQIVVNFLPTSHLAGRLTSSETLGQGGLLAFTNKSDLSNMFEDLSLVKPTFLNLVPRIIETFYQYYLTELYRHSEGKTPTEEQQNKLKTHMREDVFGGRVLRAGCGSAPISPETKNFIESVLQLSLHDGYGSTEAGIVCLDNQISEYNVTDYKLIDVPELGYFTSDKPHPRGELLVKTRNLIPGYFKRPELMAEVTDPDGYYCTGDIMVQTAPETFVYIDRRKNVLKLSQGEFVAVSTIESILGESPVIHQVYVYGNSERSYLLAVIVPTEFAVKNFGDNLREKIYEGINSIAKERELKSYEIPRDFIIADEPFTVENGLLSDARKSLRPKLKEKYGAQLEALYSELANQQNQDLLALLQDSKDRPVLETISKAIQVVLNLKPGDVRPDARFVDLGGDSLTALSFSNTLSDLFGVDVPVGTIVSSANTIGSLADYITAQQNSESTRPTFASVHGAQATTIKASELTLDKFIDNAVLANVPGTDTISSDIKTVFLTGANGYLGRFLALDWLERLSTKGGEVIAVIRAKDDAAAYKRLEEAYDTGDEHLLEHFRSLAKKHLTVLAGDIADERCGLEEKQWEELASKVDYIVHPAALVNHVLPYKQLFEPNVVGTAEVIKLALTTKLKPITYLSTVSIAGSEESSGISKFEEDSDVRHMSSVRRINDEYANGYGNSKWAGEVLLREAHDLAQLPVAVFRSDMILAHSTYIGQINKTDMFTRLIYSILETHLAPESFYEPAPDGSKARAHYDGLPADFTSQAITVIGSATQSGYASYDVVNNNADGISLDTFVDWLLESGESIERVPDFQQWHDRFVSSLRQLPDKKRTQSVLAIVHAYAVPLRAIDGGALPADKFKARVQELQIGPEKDIPHIKKEFITKNVADLHALNFL